MSVLSNTGIRAGASGAGGAETGVVANSLRFNSGDSASLSKTFSSAGNRKTWTWSGWVKRTNPGSRDEVFSVWNSDTDSEVWSVHFFTDDTLRLTQISYTMRITDQVFRDPSAWYHMVVAVDTTQATANDRLKLYINGSQITDFSTTANPSQNSDTAINGTYLHRTGVFIRNGTASGYFDGQIADVHMVDGLQLDPTSFGEEDETTGQWVPKEYTHSTSDWHTLNDGTTWSSYLSSTGALSSQTNGFTGDTSTGAYSSDSSPITFTPPSTIYFQTLRVFTGTGSGTNVINIDGGSNISMNNNAWTTVSGTGGSFSTLTVDNTTGNGTRINAIEIDGIILIDDAADNSFHLKFDNTADLGEDSSGEDNDFTANNLTAASDEVTVSTATGGLPFYNTTGDYGGTKDTGYRTDSNAGTTDGTGLVLALPGDVLTDEHDHVNTGSSAKNVVNNGTTATSTAEAKFYGTAMSFNGAGKYLEIKDGSGNPYADFAFGTGDFTVEAWVYANNWDETYQAIFNNFRDDDSTTGWSMLITNGAKMHVNHMGDYNNGTTTIPTERWVHLAMVKDGSANTTTRYIDGVQDVTTLSSSQSITNTNQGLCIGGAGSEYSNRDFDGYIQDARIYKGVAKYTSAFTVPARSTNAADIDLLADSPSTYDDGGNGVGNYCTLNPLTSSGYTISNGNLQVASGSGSNRLLGTIGVSSGKYYFEAVFNSQSSSSDSSYLVVRNEDGFEAGIRNRTSDTVYFTSSGGTLGTYSSSIWSTSDVHGFALDCDNNQLKIYKNNTLTATISLTANKTYFPGYYRDSGSNANFGFNFGARSFAYTPPTGFKALNTFNLDDPTIADPSLYFDTKTYTGNGSTQAISGLNFSSDLVWIKQRNAAADHNLFDIVRGVQKRLFSNSTAAEGTISTGLTAFNSDGWTMGSSGNINGNNNTYVGWAWDAGSEDAETNDAGSIDSEVKANTSAGFSIASYEGTGSSATVGHGLNAAPNFIIIKNRDRDYSDDDWRVWHSSLAANERLVLSGGNSAGSGPTVWQNTLPTSAVFYLDGDRRYNNSGDDHIAYCWSEVEGYSKFGTYEGNDSTDGTYVHLGFRPAMILIKNIDVLADWAIYDNKRDTFNEAAKVLSPNTNGGGNANDAWAGSYPVDFLSNGFKPRTTTGEINDTYTYIYCAWASSPFKYSNAR